MAERAKTRKCPADGKLFLKGKRALVNGKVRLVCLACAANATRVVTTITHARCNHPRCNGTAAVCVSCAEQGKLDALAAPLAPAIAAIEAMIRGLRLFVAPDDLGDEAKAHADGKLEGLESALTVLYKAAGRI
jgi:hypothetical protein